MTATNRQDMSAAFATRQSGALEDVAIVSQFADDPDIATILGDFIRRLSSHEESMRQALAEGRLQELGRTAHGLKGAGGSYGYPALSEAAAALEEVAKADDAAAAALLLGRVAALCGAIRKTFAARGGGGSGNP